MPKNLARHLHKTNSYLWLGVSIGWIFAWVYLALNNTVSFVNNAGNITIGEFVLINFIPILFLIWNGTIVYRSLDLFKKLSMEQLFKILTGAGIIIILMIVIVFPLFTKFQDTNLF